MQKKWLAIPAGIIVLGGIWTGSAWYTGKNIEDSYAAYLDKVAQETQIKIETVKYNRHIFSTDLQYKVSWDEISVPLHTTIYHGPLPINLVSHFNLSPLAASSRTTLQKTDDTQEIFDSFADQTPLVFNFDVGYQKQFDINLLINAGKAQSDLAKADWQEIKYDLHKDQDQKIKFTITIPHIMLETSELTAEPGKLVIDQLNIHADLQKTDWKYLPTGKISSSIKFLQLPNFMDNPNLVRQYKDQTANIHLEKKDDFYSMQTQYKSGEMRLNEQPFLSSQQLNIALNHFHGDSLEQFIKSIATKNRKESDKAIEAILNHQPQLIVDPLHLENAVGKAELSANVAPIKDILIKARRGNDVQLFDQLNLKIIFDKAFKDGVISDLGKLANTPDAPLQPDDVELLQKLVDDQLKDQVTQGILIEKDQSYELTFAQEKDDYYLNQYPIPKHVLPLFLFQIFAAF